MADESTMEDRAAPAASGPASDTPAAEAERSVISELRTLGSRLAAAMRAASTTAEAEALKTDLGEGLRELRGEIDKALQSAKATTQRAPAPPKAADQVRTELAGALRSLNRVLERAAESMDRPARESGDEPGASGDASQPPVN